MGNSISDVLNKYKNGNNKKWPHNLDFLMSHYLFSMNTSSLQKMMSIEYCNEWVNNISELLEKKTSKEDLSILKRRVMGNDKNIKISDISKFYVKIAHIYAVIFFSLNPVFKYETKKKGEEIKIGTKLNIPENIPIQISKFNSCEGKTIKKLKPEQLKDSNYVLSGGNNTKKSLIPELMSLYFDEYNIENGSFLSMTPSSKKMYEDDLRLFYNILSSNSNDLNDLVPRQIQSFQDISRDDITLDEKKESKFQSGGGVEKIRLNKTFNTLSGNLYIEYAIALKKLVQETNNTQASVLKIFSRLFVGMNEDDFTINPKLNSDSLSEIVKETRTLVMKLYLNCEINYTKSVQLYESIVEQKILDTTKKQIRNLKHIRDVLISS